MALRNLSRTAGAPRRWLPLFAVLLCVGLLVSCGGDRRWRQHHWKYKRNARTATTAAPATTSPPRTITTRPSSVPQSGGPSSDATCASRVVRTPELRPQNATANNTVLQVALPAHPDFDATWQQQYRTRITGNYKGTTDEIIQWAACKWGLDANLLRAQAWEESGWLSSAEGDYVPASSGRCVPGDRRNPCPTSFGILQNKWFYNPGSYPATVRSTAWSLDFSGAKLRGCLDGHKYIDGQLRPGGDMWGCLGNWFSGSWYDQGARDYVARVQRTLGLRPWAS